MKMTCLVVDDEPLAIELIQKHVQELGTLSLVGTCRNAMEAMDFLHHQRVDLIFLDIQMPRVTGIDLLRIMKEPPAIIITTAHRDYAIEGYEFDVVDYLLKPVTFTRFTAAVEKFYQRRRTENLTMEAGSDALERLIHIKVGTKVHQLNEKNILYVESIRDYVQIHFIDGKKMMLKYQIGKLETGLSKQFMRVHKSFIVNKWKITAFNATQIELEKQSIPVGANYKASVTAYFKDSTPKGEKGK